nr:tubulin polymerization-promoting protein family member 2 isoform X5 [Cavia porcellus]
MTNVVGTQQQRNVTMASEAEKTFHRFAAFGDTASTGAEINNKNFAKLCKDCNIMDGKLVTSNSVDIVFSKVKDKNARTITFQQFQEAMKELGQMRFKGKNPDEALQEIFKLMEGKEPATTGVTSQRTSSPSCQHWSSTSMSLEVLSRVMVLSISWAPS